VKPLPAGECRVLLPQWPHGVKSIVLTRYPGTDELTG
jgi:hypothetical protein